MKHLMLFVMLLPVQWMTGQKYFSKTGKISFFSEASLEKIEAHNTSASTVIDIATGAVEWAVLIQGFTFEKSLMQEHFNENYMESAKYPKAKFKGQVDNLSAVQFNRDGTYTANVSGQLEMHGVTKPVTIPATVTVKGGMISAKAKFNVTLADYNISIPKLVADNISKTVRVEVTADYQPMNP